MVNEHSPLGASSASRWLACPPSYGLIQRTGAVSLESEHAALGTAAHKLADMCLESGKDAWEYIGQVVEGFTVGNEDGQIEPDAVQVYLYYVRPLAENAERFASEVKLGNKWKPHPLYGGTADAVAVFNNGIYVVDYKHGAGLGVDPVGNPQLLYYAIGAFKEMAQELPDTADVTMVIVQPRYHGEPIKTWTTTVGELRAWSRDVLVPGMLKAERAAEDVFLPHDFKPGDHCRFCPALIHCPKQKQDFEEMATVNPETMTDAELDAIFPKIDTVKMFMRAVEGAIMARLMEGASYSQVKLVKKRSPGRIWKEGVQQELETLLGEDAYEKRLLTPPQVEKLSKKWKDFVAENAFLPEATGYNLALATDPAPAADPAADIATKFAHY